MDFLFHQNMRVFGGGTPLRNQAYGAAFTTMAAELGPANAIVVCGFTEIMNYATAGPVLAQLGAVIGLPGVVPVACGQTALANGPEFIAVASSAHVVSVGRIMIEANVSLTLIHDIAPIPVTPAWCTTVPANTAYDYRGVVYLVVTVGATNIAVGFMHNMYTFTEQRALIAQQIPRFGALMASNPAMAGGGPVYLGGDFNVPPLVRKSTTYGKYTPYAAGIPAPAPPGVVAGGTTVNGNLYDYWYSNREPVGPWPFGYVPPVPGVYVPTLLGADMSDHCGVHLRIR